MPRVTPAEYPEGIALMSECDILRRQLKLSKRSLASSARWANRDRPDPKFWRPIVERLRLDAKKVDSKISQMKSFNKKIGGKKIVLSDSDSYSDTEDEKDEVDGGDYRRVSETDNVDVIEELEQYLKDLETAKAETAVKPDPPPKPVNPKPPKSKPAVKPPPEPVKPDPPAEPVKPDPVPQPVKPTPSFGGSDYRQSIFDMVRGI